MPEVKTLVPNVDVTYSMTVEDLLGHGAYGAIYAGLYGSTAVAIKTFPPLQAGVGGKTDLAQAMQEAKIWYTLKHPNIAILYGIATAKDGYPMLVMEKFSMNLLQRLHSPPVPTTSERIKWLQDIAHAYKHLHSLDPPIYHRDLKPDNVLLDARGRAALTDFGLSKVRKMYASSNPKAGNIFYAPPECHDRGYIVTSKYDVFSFGMTAYEVLTRHSPFLGESQELMHQSIITLIRTGERPHRSGAPNYEGKAADVIPDGLWELIQKCWAQEPNDRPEFSTICVALAELTIDPSKQCPAAFAGTDIQTQFQTLIPAKTEANQSSTRLHIPAKKNEAENAGTSDELSAALKYLSLSAERGNADAQNQLGFMYSNGDGTAKDLAQGVKWLHKSAAQGHPMAQHNLSICYFEGNGVEKDVKKAKELLQKSAEQGCSPAMFKLGWRYFKGEGMEANKSEGVKWIQKAADQGLAAAQFRLAWLYEDGNGVEKSEKEAMRLFNLAAEQNYVEAQLVLGAKYSLSGVKEDLVKGTEWYRRAAELGHHEAQNSLGLAYINADGVKRDIEEAKRWLRKAAENGNERAAYHLGLLLSLPPPTYN